MSLGDLVQGVQRDAYERCSVRTTDLDDGTRGYLVRMRSDDCFAAAVATTLQVPIDEVPDPRLYERTLAGERPEEIDRSARREMKCWLANRGLRMVTHRKVPVAKARWIGVIPAREWFESHCMVMRFGAVLFDPTAEFAFVALEAVVSPAISARVRARHWGPEHVGYGLSFQKLTTTRAARP